MNENHINLLTIADFHVGDLVCLINQDGTEGEEGIVDGKNTKHISVRFEDKQYSTDILPSKLKNLNLRK